ncbi:MAG: tetratricopeptide repeat protein [Stenotrophobium sp.]
MQRSNNAMPSAMHTLHFTRIGLCLLLALQVSACSTIRPSIKGTAAATTTAPVQKQPDKADVNARFNAALDLMKQKQYPQAQLALNELSKDFPQYSGPLTDLGIAYGRTNQKSQALNAFARAVAANPQNAVAWNWLGILYRESGDYPHAEQAYQKALGIDAGNADAHLNLGILYDSYLKRPADALVQYKDYQRLGGMDDLRVAVWIAEIEKAQAANSPDSTPAAAAPQQTKKAP